MGRGIITRIIESKGDLVRTPLTMIMVMIPILESKEVHHFSLSLLIEACKQVSLSKLCIAFP